MCQGMLGSGHLDVLDDLTTGGNALRNPELQTFKEVRVVGMRLTLNLSIQIHYNVAGCPIGRMPLLQLSSAHRGARRAFREA